MIENISTKDELLTIQEFAILVHRKPQTIYKQLNNRLNPYVQLVDNQKMLKKSAIFEIYGITVEQPIQPELNNSFNPNSTDEIEFLRGQVTHLQAELEKEREHNREKDKQLLDTLNKLAETQSLLAAGTAADKQKALVEKAVEGKRLADETVVADFENGDNAKDILAQSDKEFTVIFSKEEMEKMASDPKYYAEKMHSIEGALRMSDEINAQFGFERAFGKTNGIENSADTDTKITKFGISFNSDGTTTFFAQLEKTSASQKEYLEKIQEKKAAEKKEAKKKEQLKQIEVKKATVQANSKDELLDKIKNIEWNSIKPEDNKIGGRFDFSI